MPRNEGTASWLKWVLSGVVTLLFAVIMFLVQGTAARLRETESEITTLRERVTKMEGRADLGERIHADLERRVAVVERPRRAWPETGRTR